MCKAEYHYAYDENERIIDILNVTSYYIIKDSFLFYLPSGRGHRNYIFSFAEEIKRYVTVRYVA